jgi:DNA processing protein
VDVIYPKQHHELYEQLVASGLVISEYPLGTEPRKEHFPQRNRIISGLSRGIIVAEAPMGSGALITARLAGEQGREVFALPGPIGSPYSRGTHDLIKRGRAKLVENVDDVLVEFGTNRAILRKERITAFQLPLDQHSRPEGSRDVAASSTAAGGLSAEEQQMLGALSYEGTHINDLVRKLGITTPDCIARLTMLEIKGLITAAGSGFYARL